MKELSILDQFCGFLNTPDIFPGKNLLDVNTFNFPDLKINEKLIVELNNLDDPRNSVLGKRMESFFEIAIKHSARYDLIASNIQIIENKQTLGELDFLIYDNDISRALHIELVYKLYVYDPTFPSGMQRWIGPNRRDSFLKKLEKLKSKQFPLLFKPETFKYLDKLGVKPEMIEQKLCFKAQLFSTENKPLDNPEIINSNCIKGSWYKLDEFLKMNWEENLFYSPKKKDWSCDPEDNNHWIGHKELLENIEFLFKKNKAPLVWMKTKSGFQRFFIVWW